MANSLVSIQIIPKTKNGEDVIPYVDEAIKVIQEAGVKYEVHPLETTMEGEFSELMEVIRRMNERMIEIGSSNVISQVKILYQPEGITMGQLTEKYQ
ncbi:MTH1187 family thiamine-binding protein [Siminovitchia fortis]|uniref:MTH1187 family thiamine-binding protein n=1 Tax=Siminovitchia fortis TaxID=254758 RepID=A0A443IZS8_9BACI|nr:MTH1187 family thiamine-binding protein [Siminovitchia fortis]RWR13620.1 MTH1187 family thiamine-binding protein [Siminovitchia fortis]WHY81920.1 MTH1187 family thiamine-binding protein [Siminovitchia fortis]